jgi:hypothetical protein
VRRFLRILDDRDAIGGLDGREPVCAVVEAAREDDSDEAPPE